MIKLKLHSMYDYPKVLVRSIDMRIIWNKKSG